MSKQIFKRKYCDEELADVERDVSEAFDSTFNPIIETIPLNEGMRVGIFEITVTWTPDE